MAEILHRDKMPDFLTLSVASLLIVCALGVGGCKTKTASAPIPSTTSDPSPSILLARADQYYFDHQYTTAIGEYEKYLNEGGERSAETLLRLSFSLILSEEELEKAVTILQELVSKLTPDDPLYPEVTAFLTLARKTITTQDDLQNRTRQLEEVSDQLRRIKEIDAKRRGN